MLFPGAPILLGATYGLESLKVAASR